MTDTTNDAELVQRLRECQAEYERMELEQRATTDEILEILRRHPDGTELPARVAAGHIILYLVDRSGRVEMEAGCGCTYGKTGTGLMHSPIPETEHPDGQRLYELEQQGYKRYEQECQVADRLMEILCSHGLGRGLRVKHRSYER